MGSDQESDSIRSRIRVTLPPPERIMAYIITEACIDRSDGACLEVCPVDCIYEGERARYINPDECVDCGACEPVCPVQAIYYEIDVPEQLAGYVEDNAAFFNKPLAGREAPLGNPGGAKTVGRIGRDTERVAAFPKAR